MSVWKNAQASHSKPELEKIHFVWTIDDFKCLGLGFDDFIESSIFASKDYKWSLKLYPDGKLFVNENEDIVVILVLKDGAGPSPGQLWYNTRLKSIVRFHLLNDEDKVLDSCGEDTGRDLVIDYGDNAGKPGIFRTKELDNGKLINGMLKIGVEITIIKGTVETRAISRGILSDDSVDPSVKIQCNMSDYSEFMNNKTLSDIEIVDADGKVFYGHKLILFKHSSVLAAAFQHPMKENLKKQIIIDKIRPEVLDQMLKFLYTGKLEDTTKTNIELIQKLLSAADLYDIKQLKELCEALLIKNMSTDNVLFLLVHGDTYRCGNLKQAALDYIIAKKESFFHFAEWIDFVGKYPQLTNEIFIQLAE